ncbi:MAG: site-specific DNA-methyltransferase [Neisseriaceae bacterium]|nr:site-specific DNA-methyltransferase [Neisseriaceae bacterium]
MTNTQKLFASPYTIINQDILETLQQISNESINLIIADPPYFQIKGDFDFVFQNKEQYLNWCRKWLLECKRILKNNGTLILWGGVGIKPLTFARLAIMIEDEEIFIRQNWITQRNSRGYGTNKNYMSAREDFLFLTKSKDYVFNIPYTDEKSNRKDLGFNGKPRKNTHKRVSNVWIDIAEASQSSIERCEHPTVKAQKLCDRIIQTHSNENDLIFIPFVGSGSEIISAIKNNRRVFGCEISKEYCQLAERRIGELLKNDSNK